MGAALCIRVFVYGLQHDPASNNFSYSSAMVAEASLYSCRSASAVFTLRTGRSTTLGLPDITVPEFSHRFDESQLALSANRKIFMMVEMSRNVQSGNTQNLKSMVIQRSFPKWSVAERRKTAAASDQAAVCACAHSRYFAGAVPAGCAYRS